MLTDKEGRGGGDEMKSERKRETRNEKKLQHSHECVHESLYFTAGPSSAMFLSEQ